MEALELCYMSAGGLSRLVQSREVSPVEIVDALLARIEATEPVLNSYHPLAGGSEGRRPPGRR